jgi:hypothetical protein
MDVLFVEVMGNTRDKERRLKVRRGDATERAKFVEYQQEYQVQRRRAQRIVEHVEESGDVAMGD